MNTWTKEDMEAILLQLDERKLPFKKYALTTEGGRLCLLGRGSFAHVYRAKLRKNHKKGYAVKVIGFGERHVDPEAFREAAGMQQKIGFLEKNVVRIYDYAELLVWIEKDHTVVRAEKIDPYGGEPEAEGNFLRLQFLVMAESIPVVQKDRLGNPFLMPQRFQRFDEKEILKLAFDIGRALSLAHRQQLIHRDVKLENIFYREEGGHYELGDFGIAKTTTDGFAGTRAFTKGYGAPEVVGILEDRYDCTADIYSFGMLLYVLLNGLRFPGSDGYRPSEMQYVKGYVPDPPAFGSDALHRVVLKMIRFDPDERYQSIDEVLNELEKLRYGSRAKYRREHRTTPLVLGLVFAAAMVFADSRWIAILLFSLAAALLYYCFASGIRTESVTKVFLGGNFYWFAVLTVYAGMLCWGSLLKNIAANADRLHLTPPERQVVEQAMETRPDSIGSLGIAFVLLWLVGEWLLIRTEARRTESSE